MKEEIITEDKIMTMTTNRCPSCGGIIGRDCFNPVECAQISERQATQHDLNHYEAGHKDGYNLAMLEVDHWKNEADMWKERCLEAEKELRSPDRNTQDFNDPQR